MNQKQFEISKLSRYSWTNTHNAQFVMCRNCASPLLKEEYASAINEETGKIVILRLPERCSCCPASSKKKTKISAALALPPERPADLDLENLL